MCGHFNTVGEIAGLGRIGGEKLRRRGDGAGRAWGVGGAGMGNGWRGRVTEFSGDGGLDKRYGECKARVAWWQDDESHRYDVQALQPFEMPAVVAQQGESAL